MKKIIYIHVVICGIIAMFLFAGCDKSEDVPPQPEEKVTLLISLPKEALGTRSIGDPGTAVDEGADWDQLAVILAYTDDSNIPSSYNSKVLVKTLSKTDFENLPSVSGNENVKLLSVDAWAGTVHIYGVTYSEEAAGDLVSAIKACKDDDAVIALTISNDYASGSTSKFVSVATGFYKDEKGNTAFVIKQGGTGTVGSIPRMSLKRLAAKIDIQWDATDAYPNYTDVKVAGFTFKGGASETGSGFGRLFPELKASSTVLVGNKTFFNRSDFNRSEISQRNGRVYHYVFPDGVSTPTVTFNISANDNGGNTIEKDYSLNFSKKFSPATWYKVNATIKGVTGSWSIDVFNVNDSGQ